MKTKVQVTALGSGKACFHWSKGTQWQPCMSSSLLLHVMACHHIVTQPAHELQNAALKLSRVCCRAEMAFSWPRRLLAGKGSVDHIKPVVYVGKVDLGLNLWLGWLCDELFLERSVSLCVLFISGVSSFSWIRDWPRNATTAHSRISLSDSHSISIWCLRSKSFDVSNLRPIEAITERLFNM